MVGYGGAPVLHGIDLSIGDKESVAIVGANGAGKSTMVRAICGLLRPQSGSLTKSGVDITALPAHERPKQGIAVVLEGRHLFGELSVAQNLALAEHHGRMSRPQTPHFSMDNVLAMFPVMRERLDARVELLSGGEQQMVALARALLLQPDLLIMDEPSTGLAPKVVKDIVSVVADLRSQGMSVLLVEQNAALAAQITDRAYVMSVGRIVHEVQTGQWQAFLSDEKLLKSYLGG